MARGRQNPDDWDIEYDPTAEFDCSWKANEAGADSEPTVSSSESPVTVEVDDAGLVTGASLALDWKKSVDPRELPFSGRRPDGTEDACSPGAELAG